MLLVNKILLSIKSMSETWIYDDETLNIPHFTWITKFIIHCSAGVADVNVHMLNQHGISKLATNALRSTIADRRIVILVVICFSLSVKIKNIKDFIIKR